MDSYARVIHKHVKILIIVGLVGYAALLAVQLIVEFMEEEPQFSVGTNAPMAKMEITIKDAGIRLGDCPPSCNGKCAGKHQEPSDVMVVGNGTIGQEISKPLCIICGEEHGSDDRACIHWSLMSDNVGTNAPMESLELTGEGWSSITYSNSLAIEGVLQLSGMTPLCNIVFCGDEGKTMMTIDWRAGALDIQIPEGVERTEAADVLMKWLKGYIAAEYELVRRKEYDFNMGRLRGWEEAEVNISK